MFGRIKNSFDIKKEEKHIFFIFILGVAFYAAFVLFGDLKKVFKVMLTFNWQIVGALLLLSSLNYLFRFVRWHYLLSCLKIRLPLRQSSRIFLSGLSMTVTPGKMGEVVKAYLLKKEVGTRYPTIIPLLIFERVTDGIGMILLALGGLYLFNNLIFVFVLAVLLVAGFFLAIKYKQVSLNIIKKIENRFGHIKILDFFTLFFEHSQILLTPLTLSYSIILSLVAWSFEGIALYILISQFSTGTAALTSLLSALVIFSFSSIVGFMVLLPGGIGVAEGSISSLITVFFHLPLPQVIFITILFRFVTLWFGVAVGLWNLLLSFSKH